MKKFIVLSALVILGFTVAESKTVCTKSVNRVSISFVEDTAWTKSATWTGMNLGKKVFYKINPKTHVLYSSVNAKTWSANMGGIWISKDMKWMKIDNNKLVWSNDERKTWTEVPDWTWQDADGDWCKFDAEWNLWIKKAAK
jgi:hypothetical protein